MRVLCCSQDRTFVKDIFLIGSFTFLMIISAYMRIPLFFTPVPVTMQTFVLFLNILILKRKACFSQLSYMFLGIAGLPVFCKGEVGLFHLLGPTGGYLLGFLAASIILPLFMRAEPSFFRNFLISLSAIAIVYFLGVIWLLSFHKFPLVSAISAGVTPFIIGDIFKAILATGISLKLK